MSNMSYCRMQNTYPDLQDCFQAIEDRKTLSREESMSFRLMVESMIEFLQNKNLIDEYGELNASQLDDLIDELKG